MAYKGIQELFDEAAERFSQNLAVVRGGERLTYAELRRRTDSLAHSLRAAGSEKGAVVAILLENPVAAITVIIATLKAGAAFVPLDAQIPAPRLETMLADVSPDWFITESKFLGRVELGPKTRVVCLDAFDLDAATRESLPPVESGPDDLCYIYFTSGSTGRPKGIAGRLKGVDHFIRWEIETLGIGEGDRVSQLLPLSFDGSLRDVFVPLCSGATLCVPPGPEMLLDAPALVRWMDAERISLIHSIPSLLRSLLGEALTPEHFKSLRYVLLSGEPLLPSDVCRATAVFGERVQLINLYGTSETTMAKFVYYVRAEDAERRSIPVGKPMPGARALIVDEDGRACPQGTVGEIYIRTPYRSLGYYGRPDLTAKAFVANPFSDDRNDIVYKTGDLGRVLVDGNVELLGRKDQQVKVRGVRIELDEIEGLLRVLDGVRDVAVVDREDAGGNKILCAYVVGEGAAEPGALRARLREQLPDYMVPSVFIMMDKLPRTISGKVDRRALPSLGRAMAGREGVGEPPRTPVEEVVAGLWGELLGAGRVGRGENFFELGGHSLLATQVVSRVREAFGVEVALRQLFESPTVESYAAQVEAALAVGEGVRLPPIERVGGAPSLPLSYAQQRLWFIDQIDADGSAYNVPGALRLRGRLNVHALEQSVSEIIRRHDALRTIFSTADGQPVQVVTPPFDFDLPVVDLSRLSDEEREREQSRLVRLEARRQFDLGARPLLRARLLRLGEHEHLLLFVMHHIVSDGWSLGVLVKELGALYKAYNGGAASGLAELQVQYTDYALWQRRWMDGEILDAELAYWKERLEGAPPLLELPTDRPRPAARSPRGKTESFVLPKELTADLKRLSRREGVTLFMTMLAAFDVLFQRYTGQDDIVVGTPVANRTRGETSELIGFFVNTLVMRTDLSGDPTFRELLRRVRETALGAYAHQNLPFERLVEELQPERSLGHTPLFQVALVLHNAPLGKLELPGLELRPEGADSETAKFDLTVNMQELEGELFVSMTYSTDLFDAETVERMGAHLRALLGAIVQHADGRVSSLSFLRDEERLLVVERYNETAAAYPADSCIHELFAEQAARTPDAVAAEFRGEALTYGELDRRSNRLAERLRARGVGPGVNVGIFLEHSLETVTALLGVLKAGGAYVPLDTEHPKTRLAFTASDARLLCVLTQRHVADRLPAVEGCEVIALDAEWPDGGPTEVEGARPRRATSDDAAYVIYTSGSTGRPKGVRIRHRSLVNYVCWARQVYAHDEPLAFPLYSSLAFDLTVTSVYTPLVTGGRLVIYRPERWQSPVAELLEENRVDVLKLTPSHLTLIKDSDNRRSRVRLLIVGGEALETRLAREVYESFGRAVTIVNEYGPTEATVGCMYYRFDEREGRAFVPVGRAGANAQVYVLDANFDPTPEGVAGELCISGDGLADCYLNRPGLTAQSFVPHRFIAGARMYRSGDVARWLSSGSMEYIGRRDEQVKYHGHRVELNEIRGALNLYPQVRDSVVMMAPGLTGEDVIVAYYVSRHEIAPALLRAHLSEQITRETIPNIFVNIKRLPLTLNGKIDRGALPSLAELDKRRAQRDYEPPRTPIEEVVAGLWGELLGAGRVGRGENFFELGGHSLLATQVVSRVREAFGVEVALRQLFESPTVEGFSRRVEAALKGGAEADAPPLSRSVRTDELPLSHAQQRLWFIDQLEPGGYAYNMPAALSLRGRLNLPALRQSLDEVVRRHESLRTTFAERGGTPQQVIMPAAAVPLPIKDIGALDERRRSAEAARASAAEAARPFDLARGPLFRVCLLRLGADEHMLLFTVHHIVSDGWSVGVLVREVMRLYESYGRGWPSPLEELRVQYADFAVWQRGWLRGPLLEEKLEYWRRQLNGAPAALELPTDRPRPPVQTFTGAAIPFSVPAELSRRAKELCRREEVTLFMLLLAVFKVLLYRYTGQRDIVVGTGVANRDHPETEPLIGFFINMLVLRTDLGGDLTFEQLLKRVREVCLEAYAHREVPFEKLVDELQVARDMSRQPLFQVVFVLQNTPKTALDLPGLSIRPLDIEGGIAHFDLTMSVDETPDGLVGSLEYNADLFDAQTVGMMAEHYSELLEGLVAEPSRRLLETPLPSAPETGAADSEVLVYDADLLAERDYWHGRLDAAEAAVVIPRPSAGARNGHSRPGVAGETDRVGISIGEETLARMQRLTGGSPFLTSAVLLAVLKVYLHKETGAGRVAVATPATADLGAANSVVTVDEVRDEQSFQNFLLSVREGLLAAYARQRYPYLRLLKELRARRRGENGAGDSAQHVDHLDAVTVELEGFHGKPARSAGGALRLRFRREPANGHTGGGANGHWSMSGVVEYDAGLYSRDAVERFGARFNELLGHALRETSRPIGELEMMTPRERERILHEWNRTDEDYPSESCVHQLFERQVERTPDAVALMDGDRHITYRALNARANRLARRLRALGAGPERLVGIFMERSAEMVVAVLAALKTGAAYLPLDVNYPRERLRFMAANAEVSVLLTETAWTDAAPEAGHVVCVDSACDETDSRGTENLSTPVSSDNLAYVIYTSGSTGRPKGVMVSHRGLVNYLSWAVRAYDVSEGAGALLHSPLGFDLTVTSLFAPLLAGRPVVVVGEREGVTGLADALGRAEHPFSILKLTPSHLDVLREALDGEREKVRVLVVGGEALRSAEVRRWHEESPGTKVVNEYGPTETVVGCCVYESVAAPASQAARAEGDDALTVPIGRPIANTQLYILDANQRPAPVGTTGELYIGGAGVARGYQRRADLTAERFVCDPFGKEPGGRLYRTGDMARYLEDGNIEFLGRTDEQVKIRGYRIELGEIEEALSQHEGVRDCVVLATEGKGWERSLAAYLVADEQSLGVSELHSYLAERLPSYMIPSTFTLIDHIPLTANGKVDRRALPSLGRAMAGREGVGEPPRTPIEEVVAGLWGELLGAGRVGRGENFFELGGHSLLATQVISRVREAFGVEVALRQLFESPTVEEFSRRVEAALRGGMGVKLPPLLRAAREGELPLSHAQQRLWFFDQLEPGNPFYNTPQVLRLSGALSLPALEYTLNEIVRRHEILRTRFVPAGDQVVQVICPPAPVPLPVIDLTAAEGGEAKEAAAREIVDAEIRTAFDLGGGAPIRVRLLKLDEEEHIIIFSTHHIVSDGWSLGVLIREVAALYRAHLAGESSPLPELEIQYADFAAWQRGWLQGEVLERQLAYWRERLGDAPAALALPADRPRPAIRTYRGGRLSFDLPAGLSRELRALSRREGATLFMTMLAVWQLLLARYSGQEDISVGTPIANRNRVETEPLIGFFVNTLVMRTTVSPGQSFTQLLKQVREVCLGAYAHQDVPFERVVEELQPERGLSMSPLFQVMFGLQNAPAETLELPGLKLAPVDGEVGMTKFDLMLSVSDAGETVNCLLEFDADLFDAATAERIASSYRTLLESAVSEPERDVATLPILSHDERRLLLIEWCGRRTSHPADGSVQALFEEQAERTPEATAVVCDGESITYAELNRRANGLAHYLRSQGVGPDVLVGVSAGRSAEVITGLLGILKAGGGYVPLDASYPAQRLRYMIEDAGVKLLLTGRGPREDWGVRGLRVVSVDEASSACARLGRVNPPRIADADNLAYVIYTSGSTGVPKGVAVRQASLVNVIAWYWRVYGVGPGDRVSHVASLSFDASAFEIWPALTSGAALAIAGEDARIEPARLLEWLKREGITLCVMPTALAEAALAERWPEGMALRWLHTGGDRLHRLDVSSRSWRLANHYGPTETTVVATQSVVGSVEEGKLPTIGRPIDNGTGYVLDRRMNLVPVGARGELYVGGAGVTRGYVGRPGLTAERFVPDPIGETSGARLYRTGDLVRHLPDGELDFIGRMDEQMKLRGYRIEPGEIESLIASYAGVLEAAVQVREDSPGDKRLVAYVVGDKDRPLAFKELRQYLDHKLPNYMVPSVFVELDALPLTPGGKVNRNALPAPDVGRPETEDGFAPPRTPVEEVVASIFADVLNVERVGLYDDFFSLNGHSLLATQLVARARQVFNTEITLRALFESPTVAGFAAAVEESLRGGETAALPPLLPAPREGALPLSYAQQRLWFFDQLRPRDTFYNMPAALRLTGRLNVHALEDALTEIVRRHESLRTAFRMNAGEAAQVILEDVRVDLPTVELSGLADEERDAVVRQLAESDARRPFDLASGALVRFRLLKLGELDYVLLVSMHHIISDAWSLGVFVREASELYDAYSAGLASPLPELFVQYPDYAVWQRGWMRGEALKTQLDYWKGRLTGAPELLTLPESKPRPPVQSARGGQQALTLSPELADSLKALKDGEGVTLFMLMLAAFQLLLSWRTGRTDIVVGSPVAGRNHPETEPLIGFFVNTLVMRTDLGGDPTFRELLRRVRETALGAYAHQDAPFEMLVDELAPQRSLSHAPLFQVALGVQNAPPPPPRLSGLVVEGLGVSVEVARFDLELLMIDTGAGIDAALTYSLDLFEAGDARRLLTLFESLLGSVAADPEATLQTLFASLAEADARQRASAEAEFKEAGRRSLKGVRRRPLSPTSA